MKIWLKIWEAYMKDLLIKIFHVKKCSCFVETSNPFIERYFIEKLFRDFTKQQKDI